MYSEEEMASAVAAGVLTQANADALRTHVEHLRQSATADDERFRLIAGFNDIFVVVACVLLLAALARILGDVEPWLGGLAVAAAAWGLAEFFVRKRHMALPAIVLLLAFDGGLFFAGLLLQGNTHPNFILGSLLAVAGAWLHWRRFHVPITIAAGTAAVVGTIAATFIAMVPEAMKWTTAIAFVAGIAVFALALRWDAQDPLRRTRKSDVAFWLHLLAAPLLVHAVFAALGVRGSEGTLLQALVVLVLYVALALVSVALDRRALMVSALGYVLYTFAAVLGKFGMVSSSFAITALALGSALLLLSAFWHRSRAVVLRMIPASAQRWIPPAR
jgi:MFS family permease